MNIQKSILSLTALAMVLFLAGCLQGSSRSSKLCPVLDPEGLFDANIPFARIYVENGHVKQINGRLVNMKSLHLGCGQGHVLRIKPGRYEIVVKSNIKRGYNIYVDKDPIETLGPEQVITFDAAPQYTYSIGSLYFPDQGHLKESELPPTWIISRYTISSHQWPLETIIASAIPAVAGTRKKLAIDISREYDLTGMIDERARKRIDADKRQVSWFLNQNNSFDWAGQYRAAKAPECVEDKADPDLGNKNLLTIERSGQGPYSVTQTRLNKKETQASTKILANGNELHIQHKDQDGFIVTNYVLRAVGPRTALMVAWYVSDIRFPNRGPIQNALYSIRPQQQNPSLYENNHPLGKYLPNDNWRTDPHICLVRY